MSQLLGRSIYLGQVATSGLIPNQTAASNKQIMSETLHFALDDIVNPQLVYPNYYVAAFTGAADGTEVTLGSAAMAIECSVRYPYNGSALYRAKWAGANQGSIPAGGTGVSDAAQVVIPRGSLFAVRTWASNADGIVFCDYANFGNRLSYGVTTANNVMNTTAPATSASLGYGPAAIIANTRQKTFGLLGDSLTAGTLDTVDGTLHRGILARSIGPIAPYINLGVPSDRVVWAKTNYAKRSLLLAYVSDIIVAYAVNDLLNGAAAATVHTDLQAFYALPALAGKNIWQTTATPFGVTGTYTSDAGQTAHANNGARSTFNDTLRGGADVIKGIIDLSDIVESQTKSGVFAVDRGGNALTGDGTHFNRRGYLRLQSRAGVGSVVGL